MNDIKPLKTLQSPCGRWQADTFYIRDLDAAQKPQTCHDKDRDVVICIQDMQTGQKVAEIVRNLHNPGAQLFFEHRNTPYILLCPQYHGGYGWLNLLTGEQSFYEPDDDQQYFCWISAHSHDTKNQLLEIDGCYWAAPFERMTFDFSDPLTFPYPLYRIEPLEGD